MNYSFSKLFRKQGYLPVAEYSADIVAMRQQGPWKLPLGVRDLIQFKFLQLFVKISWFRKILYIEHAHAFSPAYTILFKFLEKRNIFDRVYERNLHYPGLHSYYIEKDVKVGDSTHLISGQGISEDVSTAFSIALGEILERTISGLYDTRKPLLEAPYEEVKGRGYKLIYPPRFHRFLDIQKAAFKKINFDVTKPIKWMKGKNLITGETTLIPQQMTSWFRRMFSGETIFMHTTTNGSAGYFTSEGAIVRGLLETVQRDGFLVHWLTTTAPDVIRIESLPDEIQGKIKKIQTFGVDIYLLDVTSLSIPTVFVVAINSQSECPQVVLSGSSDTTYKKAIENALKEIAIGLEMFYFDKHISSFDFSAAEAHLKEAKENFKPFLSNLDKITRQLYWRGEDKIKEFEWFISGDVVEYDDVRMGDIACADSDEEKLHACLAALREFGEEYYPSVYLPKNILQQELGFYVAQVFIPKAFPLYLFEGYGTFDSDRLHEFAATKGKREWKLNPQPHMFS